jgi:hypothetical protein
VELGAAARASAKIAVGVGVLTRSSIIAAESQFRTGGMASAIRITAIRPAMKAITIFLGTFVCRAPRTACFSTLNKSPLGDLM